MGIYGIGKTEADDLKKLNIYWIKKYGYLKEEKSGTITWSYKNSESKSNVGFRSSLVEDNCYVQINYSFTNPEDSKTNYDYKIPLTKTVCNYGGFRYWFVCPWYKNGVYCGKRVATLYLADKYFACRHCNNLTYASRKTNGIWKSFGSSISIPELDEQRSSMRITHYAGRPTKRFSIWAKRYTKLTKQLEIVERGLHAVKRTFT